MKGDAYVSEILNAQDSGKYILGLLVKHKDLPRWWSSRLGYGGLSYRPRWTMGRIV